LTHRLRSWWDGIGRGARRSLFAASLSVMAILVVLIVLPRPGQGPAAMGATPPGSSGLGGSSGAASGLAIPGSTESGPAIEATPAPGTPSARPTAKPTSTPGSRPKPVSTSQPADEAIHHIIWVWLENSEYGSVNAASMPYLWSLARTYGLAANYFAIGHNSEMNYISSVAGQHGTYTDGDVHIPFKSVWDQLNGNWRAYQQDIPSSCSTGSSFYGPIDGPGIPGAYVERHNPATVFADVAAGGCRGHIFPLANFNPTAARFMFVTPNLCNDAHNRCNGTRLSNADNFLRAFVPEIIASPDYAHTILFITFDEGTTNIGLQGDTGGHVFTAAVAPWLSHVASNLFFDHYSLLRTVEDTFGLPCLASACQRSAMTPFLR
jgi:phosphatidylinositol-3-phosphatase